MSSYLTCMGFVIFSRMSIVLTTMYLGFVTIKYPEEGGGPTENSKRVSPVVFLPPSCQLLYIQLGRKRASPPAIQVTKVMLLLSVILLVFSLADASTSNLASFTGSTSMTHNSGCYTRKLEKSTDKIERYNSHVSFLTKCLEHDTIPR